MIIGFDGREYRLNEFGEVVPCSDLESYEWEQNHVDAPDQERRDAPHLDMG